ncbi:MAG TPA: TetR/AcrR family transcriptional regulator [Pseudonocardia sp.]|uniref:TetR/AcrR family transcriptional regulator n=1 Tax=Pseudonocardia sp. TaxID=60912 RepID=UPI002F428F2D
MPPPRLSQAERREATRAALLAAGRELFAEHGAAAVSAEQLVANAGVSRGAMYHHFHDKNDLFRAVFEQLEEQLCAELTSRIDAAPSPVEGLMQAVEGFLDACQRPEVRQIALIDAPKVLGWATWREIETRYALGVLTDRLRALTDLGTHLEEPDVLAQLVFSAAIEGAQMIATSPHPAETRAHVELALRLLAAGILGMAADRPAPSPGDTS